MKLKNQEINPKNRFDLEQCIMSVWGICEDLQLIYERFYDDHESMTVDDMANLLLGLKQMQQIRCEKLFNTFEELVRNDEFSKTRI